MSARRLHVELRLSGSEPESLVWNLETQGPWAVGRFGCDFEIRHSSVSRRHFSFQTHAQKITIKNLSQTNGIYFGSEAVIEATWPQNEWVQFGECQLRWVRLEGSAEATPELKMAVSPTPTPTPKIRSSVSDIYEDKTAERVARFKKLVMGFAVVALVAGGLFWSQKAKKSQTQSHLKSLTPSIPAEWLDSKPCDELKKLWAEAGQAADRKAILQSDLDFFERAQIELKGLVEKATVLQVKDNSPELQAAKARLESGLKAINERVDCARSELSGL